MDIKKPLQTRSGSAGVLTVRKILSDYRLPETIPVQPCQLHQELEGDWMELEVEIIRIFM
jgi:hypothetical protein